MKLFKTLQNIISKYPLIAGGAFMLLVAGSVFFNLYIYWNSPPPPLNAPLTMTFALLVIIPLAWQRLFIITAFIFIMVAFTVIDILNVTPMNCSSIAAMISIFCAAAYGGKRRNFACTASIVIYNGSLIYKVMFSSDVAFFSSTTTFNVAGLLWTLVTFLTTWWFSNTLRISREQNLQLKENTEKLIQESKDNALKVVLHKCVRITRELYNLLAYHVIVIGVQANTARLVLKQYLEKALKLLNLVETSSWRAVTKFYRLVSLRRAEKDFETLNAPPGLRQLDRLGIDMQTSKVQVKIEGETDILDIGKGALIK